ncbi:MAG: 4Fe-4S binding protein [Syntrophobacterales bacterium]|jgi:polyferredoxin|nr:4Fe-4S binding protein [Syntrophobacterales bacterium]
MRIVTVRRISQAFFLVVFLWFCVTATLGAAWYQLRGWPINWILDLDPLTALATVLATGTLYATLAWALVAIALTLFVGRFFCGFACPLGTLNQVTGWLGRRGLHAHARVEANRHRRPQAVKYYLLVALLALALMGSVQTGIFDPLPLLHRSVNLALVPLADNRLGVLSDEPRHYASAWLLGIVFLSVVGLNLVLPRFFCRFACPLGALFGLLSRFTPWRIGKTSDRCGDCRICEEYCEGACRPAGTIIVGECVMCMNCLDRCPASRVSFAPRASAAGEAGLPDLSRRGLIVAGGGLLLASMWGVGGLAGVNRDAGLIRPPGALDEDRFLARCIRCGQCMRICPGNIIQPALLEAGVQGLWTPAVNYRIGRSGCLPNCVACGQVCPTAAIRPLSLDEKQGAGDFAVQGPIRMGTAFVDRTRCLPWAMDRPCLVCHELCPVSPKAIFVRTVFETIRDGQGVPARVQGAGVVLDAPIPTAVNLASGDYYLRVTGQPEAALRRITGCAGPNLTLESPLATGGVPAAAAPVDIVVRLSRPFVDAARCIGCGMCEHECPVSGLRAIRVYAENESRSRPGRMLI